MLASLAGEDACPTGHTRRAPCYRLERLSAAVGQGACWFTPTRVGSTGHTHLPRDHDTVHPHACGEHDGKDLVCKPRIGSPPRVWGARVLDLPFLRRKRFTPTRVGSTFTTGQIRVDTAVHPHACGEHPTFHIGAASSSGSPPRVWGALLRENRLQYVCGSPPRVWGAHIPPAPLLLGTRFTPTRVGSTPPHPRRPAARSVHPHACGEHELCEFLPGVLVGSPPRVWGARVRSGKQPGTARFTPTRVGSTPGRADLLRPPTVHPHACGEHPGRRRACCQASGSPPRVWGAQYSHDRGRESGRFTPTRVGSTLGRVLRPPPRAVHPHACGEHSSLRRSAWTHPGSPPRVWGALEGPPLPSCPTRFTPTRVGSTSLQQSGSLPIAVHPHACGEHARAPARRRRSRGSPPRVWGALARGRCGPGIRPVHPHACGEHVFVPSSVVISIGSPPRVWGALHVVLLRVEGHRFTPTRVGSTPGHASRAATRPVHPHACGEHFRRPAMKRKERGSPPRVWGARRRAGREPRGQRFTPTRVGSTPNSAIPRLLAPVHPHACGEHGSACTRAPRHSVHPHACGEHELLGSVRPGPAGSPPRVWGARRLSHAQVPISRFTPTRVGSTRRRDGYGAQVAVHPHACGEHVSVFVVPSVVIGSPPRVWGALWSRQQPAGKKRFTPTRVGSTEEMEFVRELFFGSPPRVWGARLGLLLHHVAIRFTPTRVGSTWCAAGRWRSTTVHPHACGEHFGMRIHSARMRGSPPRVWGAL